MKNEFKKRDNNGLELSEEIGKGINECHLAKVMKVRRKQIAVHTTETRKQLFLMSCEMLGLKQSDVLNKVINDTINKAANI